MAPIRTVTLIACLVLMARPGAAQSTAADVTAGYEFALDRYHYFFENPSTFSTVELVPHNFQQTYWGDNEWLVLTGRYRIAGFAMESQFAVTPSRDTRGDDIDAFFQPDGDVAISGTSGQVALRSWRARHSVAFAVAFGLTWHGGYEYRRDTHHFHARQTKTVTHSQPRSGESFMIDGAETTTSEVHQVFIGISRDWMSSSPWRVRARFNAAPTTVARLTTILPIKYPGREIVFSAQVLTINPALTISRGTRWPVALSIASTHTFSYVQARQFTRNAIALSLSVGRSVS